MITRKMEKIEGTSLKPDHKFVVPTKQVKSAEDIKKWEESEAYQEYLGFIFAVGDAIKGIKVRDTDKQNMSSGEPLLKILDKLSEWIDEIPPQEQQQRFGNKAFREWHSRLKQNSLELLKDGFPDFLRDQPERRLDAFKELQVYLDESFGNATRIDYGTGHEMNFAMFCICLFKVNILDPKRDLAVIGLSVFDKYLQLVRKLQVTYRMEPAGSQGVWSLDDYQFVSFIWGAGQLVDHARVKPKSIPDYDFAEMLGQDFHFFSCIKYISTVKTGPFSEHSNQLWNVSGVPLWSKVYTGLVKMYRKEILCKFPVIQHTYFGSLLSLEEAKEKSATQRLDQTPNSASTMSLPPMGKFPGSSTAPSMGRFPGPSAAMPTSIAATPPVGRLPAQNVNDVPLDSAK